MCALKSFLNVQKQDDSKEGNNTIIKQKNCKGGKVIYNTKSEYDYGVVRFIIKSWLLTKCLNFL